MDCEITIINGGIDMIRRAVFAMLGVADERFYVWDEEENPTT